jgi:L-aminopeptidase/D-esterase-like protein
MGVLVSRTIGGLFRRVVLLLLGLAHSGAGMVAAQTAKPPILEFDFPGMRIGVAEYDDGPTGTTVFYFPDGVVAAADVRGGSPGTVNADAVRLGYEAAFINAVVFSGGSWYGLSAATGVANEIKRIQQAEGSYDFIAGVLGGIIYDVGGRRFSRITPDDDLGATALRAAEPNRFPMGATGAGRFAMQGVYYVDGEGADPYAGWPHSGQGGAFAQSGPTRVAVFTVVNALGAIVDRNGRLVRCHRNDPEVPCGRVAELLGGTLSRRTSQPGPADGPTENTTLTLVVTNQRLPFADLQRMAMQVHGSMARAIQPFATEEDGDVLYAVTTNEVDNPDLSSVDLSVLASELAWDAVLNSVPTLPALPQASSAPPAASLLGLYAGVYEFPGGGRLTVSTNGTDLTATFSGQGRIYFNANQAYDLIPASSNLFIIDAPARDVIRFDATGDGVEGLTLNPGRWALAGHRIR